MLRVNFRLIGLYVFSVVVMYLAGVYFGTFLYVLFLIFLLLPAISFFAFVAWIASVSCAQDLAKVSPVKGDTVEFRLRLRNRSLLPVPSADVRFVEVSDALRAELEDFTTYLPVRGDVENTYRITCPYRGRYRIGVCEIRLRDQLGFVRFTKRVDPVAVTVFPRVLEIPRFAPIARHVEGGGRYTSAGMLPDATLFHQLKEYRDGDGIRHVYWKKFAGTGKPYLKEYERTRRAGVRIYLDVRPDDRWDVNKLEQEDVSVEAVVAVVRYLLAHRVHTTVRAGTNPSFAFAADDISSFPRFYRMTTRLSFTRAASPESLFRSDLLAGLLESQTCLFVTHHLDPRLFNVAAGGLAYDTIFLLNRAGIGARRHAEFDSFVSDARRRGRTVITLRSSSSIVEDLCGRTETRRSDAVVVSEDAER